ncbi:MAG: glycosyltransferase family 2 protein [Elusimicrobia bacterium]|nr:glycosyltransferase family 2 protein [Elusimicrobiota bacterium]
MGRAEHHSGELTAIADDPAVANVCIVMPAYNAARTLERTYLALPASLREHVVVGDDASADETSAVAGALGVRCIRNERNLGYGGNLKRLFGVALDEGADIVVELHADDQYDSSLVDILVEYIRRGHFDVMQGNRIRSRDEALDGGMPWYRYYGNRALTLFENVWFGLTLGEWHSGLKAFRADVLRALPLGGYPNDHSFASEILMDSVAAGYRVGEVPIPVRYRSDSSSVDVPGLVSYGLLTVGGALRRPPWRRKRYGSNRLPPLTGRRTHGEERG